MSELGTMDEDDGLRAGVNVNVRRTDGRVHPAVVTAVHSRLVTVEWFENGQTKGKDVDRNALVGLNPTLLAALPRQQQAPPSHQQQTPLPQQQQAPLSHQQQMPLPLPPLPLSQSHAERMPATGNGRNSTEWLAAVDWPPRKGSRDTGSSLPCGGPPARPSAGPVRSDQSPPCTQACTGPDTASKEDLCRERNRATAAVRNEVDLCHELSRELERAARMNLAGSQNMAPVAQALDPLSRQQEEAVALAQLLRRYRAVVDVSDLWMTTDVRLLTRLLSTRALEDDAWLRELEDLVLVKMELLAGLRDSVAKLRKMRDFTGTVGARAVDVDSLRKR